MVPPEFPGLIEKCREVGVEFNNLAHCFNAGGMLDVDSGKRLTEALIQLKSLNGESSAQAQDFWKNVHTYPRKSP